MAGWNNHSYLFTQQTPRLTFNGCSLCSALTYITVWKTFACLFYLPFLVYTKLLDCVLLMRLYGDFSHTCRVDPWT